MHGFYILSYHHAQANKKSLVQVKTFLMILTNKMKMRWFKKPIRETLEGVLFRLNLEIRNRKKTHYKFGNWQGNQN